MQSTTPPMRRRGASTLEAIVAFTLLSTVLSVATPLVVRHGRLLQSQQAYRLALDELSNQHDRLSQLTEEELTTAVKELEPSPFITEHLPGVQLQGEIDAADIGKRVQLRIWWNEPNRSAAPLTLSAWHYPQER